MVTFETSEKIQKSKMNYKEAKMVDDLGWMVLEKRSHKSKTWRSVFPGERLTKEEAKMVVDGQRKSFGDRGFMYKKQKRKRWTKTKGSKNHFDRKKKNK